FQDVIAIASRIPREARGRGSRLLLTLSYALLGRIDDADYAHAKLFAAYPSISAELLLNQDWILARREEEHLLLDGFAPRAFLFVPRTPSSPGSRMRGECPIV